MLLPTSWLHMYHLGSDPKCLSATVNDFGADAFGSCLVPRPSVRLQSAWVWLSHTSRETARHQ